MTHTSQYSNMLLGVLHGKHTRMVVQRLTVDEKVITVSEHFKDDAALPLPAQMFRFGAEKVMDNTEDFSYSLLSLNPINKKNGPGTALERRARAGASGVRRRQYGRELLRRGRARVCAGVEARISTASRC